MMITKDMINEDVKKAREGKLTKEECTRDIDFLVSMRTFDYDINEGKEAGKEEKELTNYFIEKFIKRA